MLSMNNTYWGGGKKADFFGFWDSEEIAKISLPFIDIITVYILRDY